MSLERLTSSGYGDDGEPKVVNISPTGHMEVELHGPSLPFGSVHAEGLTPIFNTDAVYGINTEQAVATTGLAVGTGSGSGTNTGANNLFKCSTGTTQYSFASIQSRRRLRYHAGQGVIGRFAGFFTDPVANLILVAGFGTAESGYYFGYNGTSFGILHSTGGVRELHTFTVTTASTDANDYEVTLPNTATVNVTATNNNDTSTTAYEIAQGTYPGWSAEARGSTVIFLSSSVGSKTGSFSLAQTGAATPAAGSDAETTAGVAGTDTWVPQASWNGPDILDGNGPSGVTLDPTKGNVYQMQVQYLGFGTVSMQVEVVPTGGNDANIVTVHTFTFPNTLTSTHVSQPSFPFTMSAYSAGSTTDGSVSVGSFAGFLEGKVSYAGPRISYRSLAGVTSATGSYVPLFTVVNSKVYASRANQSVIYLLDCHAAAKSNQGLTTFYLVRNATLGGSPDFSEYSTISPAYFDNSATSCTFNDDQILWSGTVSESGNLNYALSDKEIAIQPGESITLCVRSVTATAICVGGINTREDQ